MIRHYKSSCLMRLCTLYAIVSMLLSSGERERIVT